jgi:phosphoketolase
MTGYWQDGYGVIVHSDEARQRLQDLLHAARRGELALTEPQAESVLAATDRLANAAMWLVAHMTYARRVDLSGHPLSAEDFKPSPEGHTGGSLNMAVAFAGYLAANALSGHTRAWTLGHGHCVAAIEAVNTLTGDVSASQRGRYDRSEAGLTRLVRDFYSYAMTSDGRPAVPLGSHVNPNTADGLSEGGYLGFASLQYIHMPLPGERLVAFLSDGAFEEQRGSDWAPRWWRASDSGFAVPAMVLNGRRIEQRTEISQEGGLDWVVRHLELGGFDPIILDGHDPLSYAWGILEAEKRLAGLAETDGPYPARLPYLIAPCVKGYGFPGAGTNRAHNLPLAGDPHTDPAAQAAFNEGARALFTPPDVLEDSICLLSTHAAQGRVPESRNACAVRNVPGPHLPPHAAAGSGSEPPACAMDAIDQCFAGIAGANPHLRIRVANPDELRSNHMPLTLELLKHRVNVPEPGTPEDINGSIITALNEEAVISAVLGNKAGLNLAVSYEAFAMKMLGALRQEIIFARRQKELGQTPGWISVPLIATSHTWENAKNEQSHQDPTLPEALLGEMSDTARVIFPVDANSAAEALHSVYRGHGEIACLVIPKRQVGELLTQEEAADALRTGAIRIAGDLESARVQFVAIGAYQAVEALAAHDRLAGRGVASCVTLVLEPGRFRSGRDPIETASTAPDHVVRGLFPAGLPRILLTHTRPEPMTGLLRRLDKGPGRLRALGYLSRGGTLDVPGMLFANRCTWAHAVDAAMAIAGLRQTGLLTEDERRAIEGNGDPSVLKQVLPIHRTETVQ